MAPAEAPIPMFRELLARRDLSRAAVLVYGALAVLDRGEGAVVTVRELGRMSGVSTSNRRTVGVRKLIQQLIDADLVRKSEPNGYALKYEVLGPRLCCVSYQGSIRCTPAVIEDVQQS